MEKIKAYVYVIRYCEETKVSPSHGWMTQVQPTHKFGSIIDRIALPIREARKIVSSLNAESRKYGSYAGYGYYIII